MDLTYLGLLTLNHAIILVWFLVKIDLKRSHIKLYNTDQRICLIKVDGRLTLNIIFSRVNIHWMGDITYLQIQISTFTLILTGIFPFPVIYLTLEQSFIEILQNVHTEFWKYKEFLTHNCYCLMGHKSKEWMIYEQYTTTYCKYATQNSAKTAHLCYYV